MVSTLELNVVSSSCKGPVLLMRSIDRAWGAAVSYCTIRDRYLENVWKPGDLLVSSLSVTPRRPISPDLRRSSKEDANWYPKGVRVAERQTRLVTKGPNSIDIYHSFFRGAPAPNPGLYQM